MSADATIDKYIGKTYGCYTVIGLNDERTKDYHKIYHVICNECKKEFDKQLSCFLYPIVKKCIHKKDIVIKKCKQCDNDIPITFPDEFATYNRKQFCCQSCAAKYNNVHRIIYYKKKYCLNCGAELNKTSKKYCSTECQWEYQSKDYIAKWKNGEITGTIGEQWINISSTIKKYIFKKYNYQCARCGWNEKNPYTNTLPLEIEHIDGNATNNKEDNLILLCPNCHSLTPTYRGANKGNGKRDIKWLSRSGKEEDNVV